MRGSALLALAPALAGCAVDRPSSPAARPAGYHAFASRIAARPIGSRIAPPRPVDPGVVAAIAEAAEQVKRCYRAPRVPRAALRIVSVIEVRLAADGSLASLPELRVQRGVTPDNQAYAGAMAEAAGLAIARCAPLRLPVELHAGGWDAFELTFSPRALA